MNGATYLAIYDNKNKKRALNKALRKQLRKKRIIAKKRVRQLKYRKTKAEKILLDALVKEGIVFQFQKAFFNKDLLYIVDFYFENIFGKKYVIEIDGKTHNKRTRDYDNKRSFFLYTKRGCCVKRFKNEQIFKDVDFVVAKICELNPKSID